MTQRESAFNQRNNPRSISGVAKNTSYFTLALVGQKVISFAYFAILARNLPPEMLGKYYFAISFTTIFAIFIDIGLANVLTREISKAPDRAGKLLGAALGVKLPLAFLSLFFVVVLINVLGYPELTRTLVYISSLSMVLDSFTITFWSVMRGFHNLKYESIGVFVFQVIAVSFGLLTLKLNLGLVWLIAALALASVFNFCFSGSLLIYKWRISLLPNFQDISVLKKIFFITIPFGLFAIFQRAYMYLDTVFLSRLAGDYYVGLYQIAFKIIFALQFLPMAFVASLYPVFAKSWQNNTANGRQDLLISFTRAINYLLIISIPISAGIIALAPQIIKIFKPEYAAAVLPLRIIMVSLVFIFVNFPIGSLLNACDRQKTNTANMAIVLAVSIAFNLALIPGLKTLGAAITVLLTNFLMFMLGILRVPQIIPYHPGRNIVVLAKSLLSAALMFAIIILLINKINIFLNIAIAGSFYFFVLFVLKGFSKEDIMGVVGVFKR